MKGANNRQFISDELHRPQSHKAKNKQFYLTFEARRRGLEKRVGIVVGGAVGCVRDHYVARPSFMLPRVTLNRKKNLEQDCKVPITGSLLRRLALP